MDEIKFIRNNQELSERFKSFDKLPVKAFSDTLEDFIYDVNKTQKQSGEKTKGIITGQLDNLHDASIAGQKAKISFELMLEIRKKVLESYQELMRMPV